MQYTSAFGEELHQEERSRMACLLEDLCFAPLAVNVLAFKDKADHLVVPTLKLKEFVD